MKDTYTFKSTWVTSDKISSVNQHIPVTQVYCWIISSDKKICIVSKDNLSWQLPGGHPLPGESISKTVIREVAEETGLDLIDYKNNIRVFGYYDIEKVTKKGEVIDHFLQLRTSCFVDELAKNYILLPQEKPTEKESDKIKFARFVDLNSLLNAIPWMQTTGEYHTICNKLVQ